MHERTDQCSIRTYAGSLSRDFRRPFSGVSALRDAHIEAIGRHATFSIPLSIAPRSLMDTVVYYAPFSQIHFFFARKAAQHALRPAE